MRLLLLKENYKGSNVQKRTSTIPFHLTYSGSSQVLVWIYWILAWTTIQSLPQQLLRIFISSVIRIELFQITFDKVWWGGQFFPLQEIDLRDSPLSQVPDFPYQGSRFKKKLHTDLKHTYLGSHKPDPKKPKSKCLFVFSVK